MALAIALVNTRGIFTIDGEDFDVENNVWLIGDDHEVVVIDAAHDAAPIAAAVDGRRVTAIVCTHGHNDHINAAVDLQRRSAGRPPILLHPADEMLWDLVYPDRRPDAPLAHGGELAVAGTTLRTLHTPGHSPGGICLYLPASPDRDPTVLSGSHVFGGDTLFRGGPGATGRSFSDFPTIIESIRRELFSLPAATVVHPGHGPGTSIAEESPHLDEWLARGH